MSCLVLISMLSKDPSIILARENSNYTRFNSQDDNISRIYEP